MNKNTIQFSLFLLLTFSMTPIVKAEEINSQSFIGHWIGKWDKSYAFCLDISSIEKGATAKYRWQEHPKGSFSRSEKIVTRVNKNTLKIDNILLVMDQTESNKGLALGIFTYQTRQSLVVKRMAVGSDCVGE